MPILEDFLKKTLKDSSFRGSFEHKEKLKFCFISGGETTVNGGSINLMENEISKGGRCQEMTLAFEYMFTNLLNSLEASEFSLLFSSFGSDGIDGPTDAAGAYYLSESSLPESRSRNDEMLTFLKRHDSYNYYLKHDRLLKIGSAGTNVSDIQILLIEF